MARNDQARWAPLGSEDAPDRWCTKGRRTPLGRPGPLGVLGHRFTRVTLWSKAHATPALVV